MEDINKTIHLITDVNVKEPCNRSERVISNKKANFEALAIVKLENISESAVNHHYSIMEEAVLAFVLN